MRPVMTGQLFCCGGGQGCLFSVYEYPEAALRSDPKCFYVKLISASAGHVVVEDNGPLSIEEIGKFLDDHRDY